MALTFAGNFLGAGYVSGRELWQYFGVFGKKGFGGIVFSISLLCFTTILSILAAMVTGSDTLSDLLVPKKKDGSTSSAGYLVDAVNSFLIACIALIMTAGINSMAKQLLGIPEAVTGLVTVALIAAAAIFGISGMVGVFSAAVPLLVVLSAAITFLSIRKTGIPGTLMNIAAEKDRTAGMLSGGLFLSAVNYACLNNISSIPALAPLARRLGSKGAPLAHRLGSKGAPLAHRLGSKGAPLSRRLKGESTLSRPEDNTESQNDGTRHGIRTMVLGSMLGAAMILLVAVGILAVLNNNPEVLRTEIPMLEAAGLLGPFASRVYAVLMFLAMYGVAVSTMVAVLEFFRLKVKAYSRHKTGIRLLIFGFIYAGSLAGFSNLIGVVYPVYGYLGIAVMLLIAARLLIVTVQRKRKGKLGSDLLG